MEIEILSASLVLVASLCGGLSCVFIARGRSSINKHSRIRIKDLSEDYNNVIKANKEETQRYKDKIRELNAAVSRYSRGETVTDNDMKNSGLGEVIMQLVPRKYRKAASFLIPQVEEAVKKDPALIEKVYEKIKSANTTSSKPTEPGSEAEAVQSL